MYPFSILLIVTCAYSQTYNKENATKLFEYYKIKFNKHYKNEAESQRGFGNFIINLNKVSALNEKSAPGRLYVVNMYADMDPEEILERYAISLKPYDDSKSALLRQDLGKKIENTKLYDLTKTDQYYREFMDRYNKTIAKRTVDRAARYFRFLKTLIEINKNNFEGHQEKFVDENADVVVSPHEFVF